MMSAADNPIDNPEQPLPTNPPVPISPKYQRPADAEADSWMSEMAIAAARWLGKTQSEANALMAFTYTQSRDAVSTLLTEISGRTRRLRDERPGVLLSIIAGFSFVAGVSLCLRRSRR